MLEWLIVVIALVLGYLWWSNKSAKKSTPSKNVESQEQEKAKSDKKKTQQASSKSSTAAPTKAALPQHPACRKAIPSKILLKSVAWDPKDNFLVTSTEAGLLLHEGSSLLQKDSKVFRINFQGETPSKLAFSSTGFLVVTFEEKNSFAAYQLLKKKSDDGKMYKLLRSYPGQGNGGIVHLEVAPDLKHIITCARDCVLMLWSLKGECVTKLQTKQLVYNTATISPNGKYLAIASASDLGLHKVHYTAPEEAKQHRARDLEDDINLSTFSISGFDKEHLTRPDNLAGSVTSMQFTPDAKKLITVSSDGKWRMWNTDTEFRAGASMKTALEGAIPLQKEELSVSTSTASQRRKAQKANPPAYSKLKIAPNGKLFAAVYKNEIHFWDTESGKLVEVYGPESHEEPILEFSWSPKSDMVATATSGYTRVFSVPTSW